MSGDEHSFAILIISRVPRPTCKSRAFSCATGAKIWIFKEKLTWMYYPTIKDVSGRYGKSPIYRFPFGNPPFLVDFPQQCLIECAWRPYPQVGGANQLWDDRPGKTVESYNNGFVII